MWHEIAHYFGLDEREVRRAEIRCPWRREHGDHFAMILMVGNVEAKRYLKESRSGGMTGIGSRWET